MDGIEGFGLFAGHANALLGDDAKPGLLDQRIDRAGQIARGRVRLDNRKGAFNRHDFVLESADGSCGAYIGAAGERQAIGEMPPIGPTAGSLTRAELQQFHQDEPFLKRTSRFRSACEE